MSLQNEKIKNVDFWQNLLLCFYAYLSQIRNIIVNDCLFSYIMHSNMIEIRLPAKCQGTERSVSANVNQEPKICFRHYKWTLVFCNSDIMWGLKHVNIKLLTDEINVGKMTLVLWWTSRILLWNRNYGTLSGCNIQYQ